MAKDGIRQRLHSTLSVIHIAVDVRLTDNNKPVIGLIAQYIGEDRTLEKLLLALKEIIGRHTDDNMARYVIEAIDNYRIASKLGFFQMDNATNNDTFLGALSTSKAYLNISSLSIFYYI